MRSLLPKGERREGIRDRRGDVRGGEDGRGDKNGIRKDVKREGRKGET